MKYRMCGLIFLLASISGCSSKQTKTQETVVVSLPSIENSVAEVDMSEFAYRGY